MNFVETKDSITTKKMDEHSIVTSLASLRNAASNGACNTTKESSVATAFQANQNQQSETNSMANDDAEVDKPDVVCADSTQDSSKMPENEATTSTTNGTAKTAHSPPAPRVQTTPTTDGDEASPKRSLKRLKASEWQPEDGEDSPKKSRKRPKASESEPQTLEECHKEIKKLRKQVENWKEKNRSLQQKFAASRGATQEQQILRLQNQLNHAKNQHEIEQQILKEQNDSWSHLKGAHKKWQALSDKIEPLREELRRTKAELSAVKKGDCYFCAKPRRGKHVINEDVNEQFVKELRAYQREHGHCKVLWRERKALFRWIQKVRAEYRNLAEAGEEDVSDDGGEDGNTDGDKDDNGVDERDRGADGDNNAGDHDGNNANGDKNGSKSGDKDGNADGEKNGNSDSDKNGNNIKRILTPKLIVQLMRIPGFSFEQEGIPIKSFDERFQQLLRFREKHGHLNVPRDSASTADSDTPEGLAQWVKRQRYIYKLLTQGKTHPTMLTNPESAAARMQRLKEIGFVFCLRDRGGWGGPAPKEPLPPDVIVQPRQGDSERSNERDNHTFANANHGPASRRDDIAFYPHVSTDSASY